MTWAAVAVAAEPALRCDAAALARGQEALAQVGPEHVVALSAAALAEACRWPAPVAEALARVSSGWPGPWDLQLAVAAPAALEASCPGGVRAIAAAATLSPPDARRHVYAACRPGFATEAEWVGAPGLLVAPILLSGWLAREGVAPAGVRGWARGLAGLSDRAQDHPVREFRPLFPEP